MPRPRLTAEVKTLLRRALPVAFGAGVYQINIMAGTVLASLLPAGSVSFLFYADRINQLPYGIIGVAVSTALLPVLSRQVRSGESEAALASQNRALEVAILLMLPAAAALMVLAEPIIDVLFRRGAFGLHEVQTAAALAAFAAGLPALMLVKSLTPGFYAREDTVTPVKIAALVAVVNVGLAAALMFPLSHVGIALASSVANWLNASMLAIILYRRGFRGSTRGSAAGCRGDDLRRGGDGGHPVRAGQAPGAVDARIVRRAGRLAGAADRRRPVRSRPSVPAFGRGPHRRVALTVRPAQAWRLTPSGARAITRRFEHR